MAKNLVLGPILARVTQIRVADFFIIIFFFNLTLSVTTYHGQLSSCTISEKNIQSWENLVTRQTDG